MQIKKFEAPTIQEALDTIKRELGPEAIILQTRTNKSAFGLMSRDSVEVTAAVSERSLQKKRYAESKLPDTARDAVKKMPAQRQAEFYEKYSGKSPQADGSARAGAQVGAQPGAQAQPARPRHAAAPGRDTPLTDEHLDGVLRATRDRVEVGPRGARSLAAGANAGATAVAARSSVDSQAEAASRVPANAPKGVTPTRYIEIDAQEMETSPAVQEPERGHRGGGVAQRNSFLTVEEEVRHLKRMIEELKSGQDSRGLSGSGAQALLSPAAAAEASRGALGTPALQDAFEQLVINGVDKRYALQLLKQVSFELGADRRESPDDVLDQLAAELMRTTEIRAPLLPARQKPGSQEPSEPAVTESRAAGPVIIALVGPTGVGKTTTVAKMASEALLKRGLRVGLINLDSYKVAAFDQLGTYAKILNVPFRSAASAEELVTGIKDFQGLDLVLIDTTGRSQRDPTSLKELQNMLKAVPELRSQLVLSVTTRDNELYDMANRFAIFRPEGISVSKLDEATIYGSLYNVHRKARLPLLYFTTGQRVPEDIEEATPERVAALILDL